MTDSCQTLVREISICCLPRGSARPSRRRIAEGSRLRDAGIGFRVAHVVRSPGEWFRRPPRERYSSFPTSHSRSERSGMRNYAASRPPHGRLGDGSPMLLFGDAGATSMRWSLTSRRTFSGRARLRIPRRRLARPSGRCHAVSAPEPAALVGVREPRLDPRCRIPTRGASHVGGGEHSWLRPASLAARSFGSVSFPVPA